MLRLTPARRRGLAVLAAAERAGGTARVSNVTRESPAATPCVYWQVAYWLRDNGLARVVGPNAVVELTDEGRKLTGTHHG